MSTPEAWRVAVQWAVSRSHEIVMYLINSPDDLDAWAELARITAGIRAAATTRAVDEMSDLAETLVEIAQRRVLDDRVAQDLETAATRLLVLSERASQSESPTWRQDEDAPWRVPSGTD